MVKPAALLPNPKDGETSVSRHGPEPSEELWELGLAAAGARPLYGAAIFEARVVRAAQLEVLADEPPPRHAVIQGWPRVDNDPEFQKAKQKELAALIVSASGPRCSVRILMSMGSALDRGSGLRGRRLGFSGWP